MGNRYHVPFCPSLQPLTGSQARLEAGMESLLLLRRALASPTMCRFIPALSVPRFPRTASTPPPPHATPAHAAPPPRLWSQRISFAAHASLGTSGVRFLKAPHLLSKAVMREGRTASVRPGLADRLAAKDKTLPRVLDGNSAHPRTPGACCAWLQTKRPRAHFSFRRCFQV